MDLKKTIAVYKFRPTRWSTALKFIVECVKANEPILLGLLDCLLCSKEKKASSQSRES